MPSIIKHPGVPFVVAGVLLGLGLAVFLNARRGVRDALVEIDSVSVEATQAAIALRERCISPAQCRDIERQKADVEGRYRDCRNPAAVVSGLSETCRRHGATVLEISPVDERTRPGHFAPSLASSSRGARYRLIVTGTYRELAALLEGCRTQRLPAAVVELAITPAVEDDPVSTLLRADMILECFQPPDTVGLSAPAVQPAPLSANLPRRGADERGGPAPVGRPSPACIPEAAV